MSTMHLDATRAHYRENVWESGRGRRQGRDRGHKGLVRQGNNEMRPQGAHEDPHWAGCQGASECGSVLCSGERVLRREPLRGGKSCEVQVRASAVTSGWLLRPHSADRPGHAGPLHAREKVQGSGCWSQVEKSSLSPPDLLREQEPLPSRHYGVKPRGFHRW